MPVRWSQWFFFSMLSLGCSVSWFRSGPALLVASDAGCYARVAEELATRPILDFVRLTLGGLEFFEHPPLGFWLESIAFRLLGASVGVAVGLANFYACLTLLFVGLAARRWVEPETTGTDWGFQVGGWSMAGLLVLPGFLHESQVAMLEMPLAAATALGLFALSGLRKSPRLSIPLFALAVNVGFWIKGPPILVLIGLLVVTAGLRWIPIRTAAIAGALSVGGVLLSTLAFDGLRYSLGLEPFFQRYLQRQVIASVVEGRHNPEPNPFFYLPTLFAWYLPGVIGVVLGIPAALFRRWLAWLEPFPAQLAMVGVTLWGGVVVGFSFPVQKYNWYIHFGMVGAALVTGSLLALIPRRAVPGITVAVAIAALTWPLVQLLPRRMTPSQLRIQTIQQLQFPNGPNREQPQLGTSGSEVRGRVVADCTSENGWVEEHLMAFVWRARRVECDQPAPWRFDGHQIVPNGPN